MNTTRDDEIDLLQFFKTLWDGKWIISAFILLFLLLGAGFYKVKNPVYESKLTFEIDHIPPYYEIDGKPDENRAFADFQKIFYSANIFRDWKKVNTNTLIKFEDFSKTKTLNGTIIQKNTSKITFEIENKHNYILLINSKNLKFLDDVYNYTIHVNNFLKLNYKSESNSALSMIKKDLDLLSKLRSGKLDYLTIELFLIKLEKGAHPFIINRPTMPIKVLPKLFLILILSLLLGVSIGCFWVIIRNVIHKSKK